MTRQNLYKIAQNREEEWHEEAAYLMLLPVKEQKLILAMHRTCADDPKISNAHRQESREHLEALERLLDLGTTKKRDVSKCDPRADARPGQGMPSLQRSVSFLRQGAICVALAGLACWLTILIWPLSERFQFAFFLAVAASTWWLAQPGELNQRQAEAIRGQAREENEPNLSEAQLAWQHRLHQAFQEHVQRLSSAEAAWQRLHADYEQPLAEVRNLYTSIEALREQLEQGRREALQEYREKEQRAESSNNLAPISPNRNPPVSGAGYSAWEGYLSGSGPDGALCASGNDDESVTLMD